MTSSRLSTFHRWYWHFVGWGFRQLYTRFAWTYDLVAWIVSRGRWKEWGRAAVPRIEGARVLEIGSGPGHLLAALATEGFDAFAIDLSPQMVRIAQRRLRRQGTRAGLVRGRAQTLPWPDAYFDSVVMTFPAGFILHPATLTEIWRVLQTEGRVVVVDNPELRDGPVGELIKLAFRITHGGGAGPALREFFEEAGFAVTSEEVHWPDSSVEVLIGTKKDQRASLRPSKRSPLIRQGG